MMHLITGRQGTDHITSANEGYKNSLIFGRGNYIFDAEGDFYARKIDDNTIRISKGQGMMNGRAFENLEDTDLNIMTGTVALKRIDLICVRYEKNPNTELEKVELVVITGQKSVSTPTAPSYNEGNILNGDLKVDFPLYEVLIDGTEIANIKQLFVMQEGLVADLRKDIQGKLDESVFNQQMGNVPLETTAKTIKGAINEHETNIQQLDSAVEALQEEVGLINGAIDFDFTTDRVAVPLTNGQTSVNYTLPYDAFVQIGSRNNLFLSLMLNFGGTWRALVSVYSPSSGSQTLGGMCLKKGTQVQFFNSSGLNTSHQNVMIYKLK